MWNNNLFAHRRPIIKITDLIYRHLKQLSSWATVTLNKIAGTRRREVLFTLNKHKADKHVASIFSAFVSTRSNVMQVKTSSMCIIFWNWKEITQKKNVDEIYIRRVRASIANVKVATVLWDRSQHPPAQWIWGAADEAVLNKVYDTKNPPVFRKERGSALYCILYRAYQRSYCQLAVLSRIFSLHV